MHGTGVDKRQRCFYFESESDGKRSGSKTRFSAKSNGSPSGGQNDDRLKTGRQIFDRRKFAAIFAHVFLTIFLGFDRARSRETEIPRHARTIYPLYAPQPSIVKRVTDVDVPDVFRPSSHEKKKKMGAKKKKSEKNQEKINDTSNT